MYGDAGCEVYPQYVVQGDYKLESGYEAMATLMHLNPRPTAVFCANDNMAMGALRYLQEQKIAVPEQVALVGVRRYSYGGNGHPCPHNTGAPAGDGAGKDSDSAAVKSYSGRRKGVTREIIMDSELVVRKSS